MHPDQVATFESHRDRLFGVAYRMTGSVSDSQDICQEAWLRWQGVDPDTVRNAEAFLVRVTTRLAIDRATAAMVRHETYVGPDLPEPVLGGGPGDQEHTAELADSLTFAFLVLLDELKPIERAVFLLHDVFGYSFDEVADSVGRTAVSCRQIASRTRHTLSGHSSDYHRPSPDEQEALITRMISCVASGDIATLMTLLAPDVVQLDDAGAGKRAARLPIVGPQRVARFIVNIAKRIPADATMEFVTVNGGTGLLFRVAGIPDMVMSFAWATDGRMRRMFVQMNPGKLSHLS